MTLPVVETARAKVNLALHVLGRRADGYHEIDSAVAFTEAGDVLTVVAEQGSGLRLSVSGPFAGDVPTGEDNLVCKAHALLSQCLTLPAMTVRLEKNLPVAAGIGGGSADAAAAIRAMLRAAGASLPPDTLNAIALKLGADVPVCLRQQACRMQGIGEILSALPHLPAPALVLVNPGVPCETASVFSVLGLARGQAHGSGLPPDTADKWRNDLTEPAIRIQPVIGEVLGLMRQQEKLTAVRMSGSGSTCFGLAASLDDAQEAARELRMLQPGWWVLASRLS